MTRWWSTASGEIVDDLVVVHRDRAEHRGRPTLGPRRRQRRRGRRAGPDLIEPVFAAGDVAAHDHPLYGPGARRARRHRHKQAAAAANHARPQSVFDDPHWFWSDQYDVNVQDVGHAAPTDPVVIRGDLEEPGWSAFWLRDGGCRWRVPIDHAEDLSVARELIAGDPRSARSSWPTRSTWGAPGGEVPV